MGRASLVFAARFGVAALAMSGLSPLLDKLRLYGGKRRDAQRVARRSIARHEGGHPPAAALFREDRAIVAEAAKQRPANIAAATVQQSRVEPGAATVAPDPDHV